MTRINPCAVWALSALWLMTSVRAATAKPARHQVAKPNIILCMTDDQGWGDVSYNGLKQIRTPTLDAMAAEGLRFNRFYAAHPSCSPTRASVMTGRHPYRSGVFWPGMPLRIQEMTIAQAVKRAGYTAAHFGKWHLSGGAPGKGRPLPVTDPLHPGHFGFDEWFTVSNWFDLDWTFSRKGEFVKVKGDGSDAIVAEALTFIENNAKQDKPFLAVIWFGSPHVPLQPTPEDLKAAGGSPYYGELVGVDRSMRALRKGLRKLGIADNTMLWFCSDNGAWMDGKAAPDAYGSNGVLRGCKGQLWEGGIRVPGLIEWPARIKRPVVTDVPVVTSDIYPTIVDLLNIKIPDQIQPLDGISIMPLLDGQMKERPKPIGFWHPDHDNVMGDLAAWNDNRYKLHKHPGNKYELYELTVDSGERTDIAAQYPEIVDRMKAELETWQESVRRSNAGKDYPGGLPARGNSRR
jgi:arylsulfatase A-like enzyme